MWNQVSVRVGKREIKSDSKQERRSYATSMAIIHWASSKSEKEELNSHSEKIGILLQRVS